MKPNSNGDVKNIKISIQFVLLQISEVAKLKPVEVELKKLEDLSEAIVQDFARMRKNEEESRDTNGKFYKNNYISNFINYI